MIYYILKKVSRGTKIRLKTHLKLIQVLLFYLKKIPGEVLLMSGNPRYSNGNLRRKHRARMKALGEPCGICKGRLGAIHYDEPSDSNHPLSFVIDEIHPVSRWREFGYPSPDAAARDWNNLQPAHYCCNAAKSNRTMSEMAKAKGLRKLSPNDGNW